jgi:hypothetical protein
MPRFAINWQQTGRRIQFCMFLPVLLTACGPAPSDLPRAGTESDIPIPVTHLLHAQPPILTNCTPVPVKLTWDAGTDVPYIDLFVGDQLFVSAASSDSQMTGPWVQPGTVFTLKHGKTGEVLERLVIGGPHCQP